MKPRPKIVYDRGAILREAEAGARAVHKQMHHLNAEWTTLGEKVIGLREQDRVARALKYANWRMDAYDRGEVDTPY